MLLNYVIYVGGKRHFISFIVPAIAYSSLMLRDKIFKRYRFSGAPFENTSLTFPSHRVQSKQYFLLLESSFQTVPNAIREFIPSNTTLYLIYLLNLLYVNLSDISFQAILSSTDNLFLQVLNTIGE